MAKNKITAVLGPTNTGKTFLAIETMLSFDSGMIGFPLRLLAREVYDKIIKKIKGKKVFFRASNIFSYHMSHAHYTIDELFDSFFELMDVLKQADGCWFSGTIPTKERGRFWV